MTSKIYGWRRATNLVRAGLARTLNNETTETLYLNSGFVFNSAAEAEAAFKGENDVYIYSRYGNPTVNVFEQRLAAIEGAEMCRATATGMAAVFSALSCQLKSGDRIVAARELFGSCHHILSEILPRWGIETAFVNGSNLDSWRIALSKPANAVFLESPSNPMLDLVDIAAVAELAHSAGAKVIVDNVLATPLFQNPLALGADIVVYSSTKHIDGHGRCLGGAVLSSAAWMNEHFIPFYRNTGPSISSFNAWIMAKSLETMELRVERMTSTASKIASWLSGHEKVLQVRYPGLANHPQHYLARRQMIDYSNIVTIEVAGGKRGAFNVLDSFSLIDLSNNLGDAKSLACHPATTTHARIPADERIDCGITDGILRISVGLEHIDDLMEDLLQALAKAC
ncbi:O-succinylhomoserine sulfhydrylase [Candidatus Endolissoclinum faulkneri L5]|uniref:O-succinylhomoserine sulfhydrylase n=1 Tax=Candidatus Endolissoclinum faulkneri L5 TaxID=1401328 RepID=V9TVS2_9PROT|nr:O-succinylhomoserine sulfhydrylase [Candidatus Endolissoclinum faulkneri]AHC73798.1 O-succinylhomoserine sulfhydrylase [Candidatus Endolissoclinum faulkneri L5]